jgi:hypothetical protein
MVRSGSGFGRAGMRPKYLSMMGMMSLALMPPTIEVTRFDGP